MEPQPVTRHRVAQTATAVTVQKILPSGVRVVVRRDPGAPVVAMRAVWSGGVRLETPDTSGITHLLSRMLVRGCGDLSAQALAARVEDLAGSLGGVAGRHVLGLRAEWPAERWEEGLELMAACLASPTFEPGALVRERQRLVDELRTHEHDPAFAAFRTFAGALFHRHPYRLDVGGTPASVAGIGRDQLISFHGRHFPVGALTLAIVGDVDPARVLDQVRRHLGGHAAPSRPPLEVEHERFAGRPARSREVYRRIERDQAHLVIGFPGTTLDHPDRFALEVLTAILGGQDGRLAAALRDRGALAHRMSAISMEGVEPGYVAVYLACSPDRLAAAVSAVRAELARLVAELVDPAELERARRQLIRTHEASLQRPAAVAAALAFHEAFGLGHEAHERYADAIAAVSAADVQRVAHGYLDDDLAITATVAPLEASPEAARRIRGVKKRAPRHTTPRPQRRAPGR